MAEVKTRQAAVAAAGKKNQPAVSGSKERILVLTTPSAHALAQDDLLVSDHALPVGIRFTLNSRRSHAALGSGVTLSVGIRHAVTKEVIDATAIAAAVDVSAAGNALLTNGTKIKDGIEYITTVPTEVYATFGGGNPTDNAQARLEIAYLSVD